MAQLRHGIAGREEVPPVIRLAVLQRDKWTCQRCGLSVGSVALEIHHRHRLADGGSNAMSNLETLCGGSEGCHVKTHQDKLAANNPVYAERRAWARRIRELQHE